jgi:hypothetical protein
MSNPTRFLVEIASFRTILASHLRVLISDPQIKSEKEFESGAQRGKVSKISMKADSHTPDRPGKVPGGCHGRAEHMLKRTLKFSGKMEEHRDAQGGNLARSSLTAWEATRKRVPLVTWSAILKPEGTQWTKGVTPRAAHFLLIASAVRII